MTARSWAAIPSGPLAQCCSDALPRRLQDQRSSGVRRRAPTEDAPSVRGAGASYRRGLVVTPPAGDGDEPVSRDDLRRVEARLEARLQEVFARLVLHDGRFAAMSDRVSQADRRADTFRSRLDSELAVVDRRFDGLDSRLDSTTPGVLKYGPS